MMTVQIKNFLTRPHSSATPVESTVCSTAIHELSPCDYSPRWPAGAGLIHCATPGAAGTNGGWRVRLERRDQLVRRAVGVGVTVRNLGGEHVEPGIAVQVREPCPQGGHRDRLDLVPGPGAAALYEHAVAAHPRQPLVDLGDDLVDALVTARDRLQDRRRPVARGPVG